LLGIETVSLYHFQEQSSSSSSRLSLASAQWDDNAPNNDAYAYAGNKVWLGRHFSGQSAGYIDDRHICLVSGSRGGKGTSFIVNNLVLWPGSCVVVDPKGENATVTAARRGNGSEYCEGMGQTVHVLDPFAIAQVPEEYRASFNPLDAIDPYGEDAVDEVGRIANSIVVADKKSKDPFWDESARELLKGLILHVLTAEYIKPDQKNLITVRQFISRGDWITTRHCKILFEEGVLEEQDIPSPHTLLFQKMAENEAFNGAIAGIGQRYVDLIEQDEKLFRSVLQTLNTHTEFLDSPGLMRTIQSSSFSLSELKTNPKGVTVYLTLPQRYMETHYRWLRMMISLTVTEMEKVRHQPLSGHSILMLLDEFAGLKRMEIIESAVAQMAGFGLKLFFVLQTLAQLKETYGEGWETFLANAGTKIFSSIGDDFSAQYISKLIGETEVLRDLKTSSSTQGTSDAVANTKGTSHQKTFGKSSSTSNGTSWGRSSNYKGWLFPDSRSRQRGGSDTTTTGTSSGESWGESTSSSNTHTLSESLTQGYNQNLQKTLLISSDEVMRLFSRVDDTNDPRYPGLALVLIMGNNPFPVKRTNYYQDSFFLGTFDPHPDHPNQTRKLWSSELIRTPNYAALLRDPVVEYSQGSNHSDNAGIYLTGRLSITCLATNIFPDTSIASVNDVLRIPVIPCPVKVKSLFLEHGEQTKPQDAIAEVLLNARQIAQILEEIRPYEEAYKRMLEGKASIRKDLSLGSLSGKIFPLLKSIGNFIVSSIVIGIILFFAAKLLENKDSARKEVFRQDISEKIKAQADKEAASKPEITLYKPSFSCQPFDPMTSTEKAICTHEELANADVEMRHIYDAKIAILSDEGDQQLRDNQAEWRSRRNTCGSDTACILNHYKERIQFLKNLDYKEEQETEEKQHPVEQQKPNRQSQSASRRGRSPIDFLEFATERLSPAGYEILVDKQTRQPYPASINNQPALIVGVRNNTTGQSETFIESAAVNGGYRLTPVAINNSTMTAQYDPTRPTLQTNPQGGLDVIRPPQQQ
jgi:type IV secretory pathway TraG/TraD family ATPase VirD4/uncharacterized protein